VFTGQQVSEVEEDPKSSQNISVAKDRRIKKLEEELVAARADMGSIMTKNLVMKNCKA
jgi:two-component system CheB/CheR fusion protein